MKQMNIIATACLGGILVAFTYMLDFYPLYCLFAYIAVLLFLMFAPDPSEKRKPSKSEPWYMK
jgi:hypothetical protein